MFKPFMSSRPPERAVRRIPLKSIHINARWSRRPPGDALIAPLAASIRRHGLLSPLLVRPVPAGYELIAGQRRLLALQRLGRAWADAIVLPVGDCECAMLALTENLQRRSLHFLDMAETCRAILAANPITRERLAWGLCLRPVRLMGRLKLLRLSPDTRRLVRALQLSERHAKALLKLPDTAARQALARQAAEERLSPRQLEARIEQLLLPQPPRRIVSRHVRDNRIIINALTDTVKELQRIGVTLDSRVDEREDHIDVIVTIPVRREEGRTIP